MEILIEDTNLVDKELEDKIRKKLKEKIQEFDPNKKYTINLQFCESLILCESEIDSYDIPEEFLPKYQKGKELKGKDKMYELLGYRIDLARKIANEYGIKIGNSGIRGMPFIDFNKVELSFSEEEKKLDSRYRPKNDRNMTFVSIMPSFLGAISNLNSAMKEIENKRETELGNIFGDEKEYGKYKVLIDKSELCNILNNFKKEYGDKWMYSIEHKSELKKKFIRTIEVKAGVINDDTIKGSVLKPIEFETVSIYKIPVYKITKKVSKVHKYIGYINLGTSGRIINVKYEPNSKAYIIQDEIFDKYFISVTTQESNKKLIKIVEELVNRVDEECQRFGYAL